MVVRCNNDRVERNTVQIPALQFRRMGNFVFKELLPRFFVIYDSYQFECTVSHYSVNNLGDIAGALENYPAAAFI